MLFLDSLILLSVTISYSYSYAIIVLDIYMLYCSDIDLS